MSTANTTAGLLAALATAQGVITLAPGQYADLVISGTNFANDVVITAADPANPPVFNKIGVFNSSGIVFENIKVTFQPDASSIDTTYAVKISQSSSVTVRGCDFWGGDMPAGTQRAGYPMGRAVWFDRCQNVDLIGCTSQGFMRPFFWNGCDGILASSNDVKRFGTVPFAGGDNTNITIARNKASEARPFDFPATDHGDFVHFYALKSAASNVEITDNQFDQGAGVGILGVNLQCPGNLAYQGVTIRGNTILSDNGSWQNASGQGVRVDAADGITIADNVMLSKTSAGLGMKIVLGGGVWNGTVDRNTCLSIGGGLTAAKAAAQNVTMTGNITGRVI